MSAKQMVVVTEAERLVDTLTLAAMTGYAPYTLRQLAKVGTIPVEKFGRSLRFNPARVLAALRERKA